jgi:hypothetical protein
MVVGILVSMGGFEAFGAFFFKRKDASRAAKIAKGRGTAITAKSVGNATVTCNGTLPFPSPRPSPAGLPPEEGEPSAASGGYRGVAHPTVCSVS